MAKFTVVVSESPYGREKAYTALRFAITSLIDEHDVNLFLVQDGVFLGLKEQAPKQYPNHFELLKNFVEEGGKLRICGVCTDARGINGGDLIDAAEIVGMHDFVEWVAESDKVLMF
ncbi:MAG: DsrE/DsrF/TusD sulfur relay family protein [Promethearchaeota archaeon]